MPTFASPEVTHFDPRISYVATPMKRKALFPRINYRIADPIRKSAAVLGCTKAIGRLVEGEFASATLHLSVIPDGIRL